MTIALAPPIKTARITAVRDAIDAGTGTAKLLFLGGSRPADGGPLTAILASVDLPVPCGAVQDNIITLDLPDEFHAIDDGDITWARILDRDGGWVADMDAGDDPALDMYISPATVFVGGVIKTLDNRLYE